MNAFLLPDQDIAALFSLPGSLLSAEPYGNGHINDTFLVGVEGGTGKSVPFIFQRINHEIFKDVPGLMANIQRVTDHLRSKVDQLPPDQRQRVLTIIPAKSGDSYANDTQGRYWRVYEFLDRTETIEIVQTPKQAYEAAKAFAVFQGMLMDLPLPPLQETIPDFHHTPKRLAALEAAAQADVKGRLKTATRELDFALQRRELTHILTDKLEKGKLPLRTTHNDTKINNIRFDCATGRGGAVIDLDTVMPGLVHYDFGDMIRTACFEGVEDGRDLNDVCLRQDFLAAVFKGFLEGGKDFLTAAEKECLPTAGPLICLEIGIRFLTDYLQGDVYFKTHRPNHNLERARVQFRRVECLEAID